MKEYEQILLGTWLRGENLNDIRQVDPIDFEMRDVVRQLRNGRNLLEIGTDLGNLAELSKLTTLRSDILYKQAFVNVVNIQIRREIAEGNKSLKEIRQKLDYLDGINLDDIEETKDPAVSLMKELDERANRKVIKWDRLPSLNRMTQGIKRKELTAIAARPSVGKSAFALHIAYGAWKQGAKVLYFPLEMSMNQSYARILVMRKYATSKEVQTGKFKDQGRLQLGIDHIDEMYKSKRFKVYEGESSIEHIESAIKKEKPFMVVIDQLTQMRANVPFKDIRAKFSYMTSNLKRIALKENVAVLLLCQINRGADDIKPTMANLKESGSIEEDSDNVILIHRLTAADMTDPSAYDWDTTRPLLLNLAKQRDGETDEFRVDFKPANYEFYERANEYEQEERNETY